LDAARRSPLALGGGRRLIVASLVALTLVAWAYLWLLAAGMARGDMSLMGSGAAASMQGMLGMGPAPWTGATFGLMLLMWWIMMVGMMVPSSMPTILLYARVQHHWLPEQNATRHVALFTAGYLLAWAAFSAVATTVQWALNASGLLAPMTMSVSSKFGAALFAVAGVYQLSPLKSV
jgi:predicted metal-binding membrane protein